MQKDIREMTLGCGHCRAANIASHKAQQKLTAFATDAPFNTIAMDIWHPGAITSSKHRHKHVLIATCLMTTFVLADLVTDLTAETITHTFVTSAITVVGLPKMIVIDAGSEFAGILKQVCNVLGIWYYAVSRGNHKAVLSKRVNKYLNKCQQIHYANTETMEEWAKGIMFAVYAWNAGPINGTDIIQSFAAIGREFPLLIDIEESVTSFVHKDKYKKQVINHMTATFPMLYKQRELLKCLTDKRRSYHRNLKNKNRKT